MLREHVNFMVDYIDNDGVERIRRQNDDDDRYASSRFV